MKIFKDSPWEYTYCGDEEGQYLQVLCGGVGMYEITIILTVAEIENARTNTSFIKFMVEDVRNNPRKYSARNSRSAERKVNEAIKKLNNGK